MALLAAAATLISGCASTIAALQDSPSKPHTLRPGRFFTLTGERRLAFQVSRADAKNVAWCAESLPETSQAVSATSKPNVAPNKVTSFGTEDSYSTALTQTFTRTEIAEIYRQMAWQACQAWAQGVYDDKAYAKQLDALLASGIKVIELRASQPIGSASSPEPHAPAQAPNPASTHAADPAAAAAKAAKCKKTPNDPACAAGS